MDKENKNEHEKKQEEKENVNKEFDEINNGDIDTIIAESKLKSSINFKSKVDEYLKYLEKNYLPKEDFILENVRIMRYENIQNLFEETYKDLDFEKRINEVKNYTFSMDGKNLPIDKTFEQLGITNNKCIIITGKLPGGIL